MVHWTEVELQTVAKAWINVCRRDHCEPLNPPMFSRIIAEAQNALPANRHRPKASLQGRKNLRPLLREVGVLLEREKRARNNGAQPTTTEIQKTAQAIHIAEPEVPVTPTQNSEHPIHSQATDERLVLRNVPTPAPELGDLQSIIENLASNIATMVVNHTITEMTNAFKREFPKLHQQAQAYTKSIPKILVVGPLVKQQEFLEESVKGLVELRFVSSEEGTRLVQTRGANCAACLIWIDKVSHGHQDSARVTFARESIRCISGGLESIKAALEDISLQVAQ